MVKKTSAFLGGLAAAVSTLLVAGCSLSGSTEGTVKQTTGALSTPLRASVPVPAGADFRATALGATETLQISDHVQVNTTSGATASVTNTGTVISDVGIGSQLGSVTSVAPVALHDGVHVNGSVTSGSTIARGTGVTVSGVATQNALLTPAGGASWQIQFQQSSQDVTLFQSQSTSLAAGAYSRVTVYPTAQLTLHAGTYFIDQLDLEPQGTIKLDESAGPIFLYVRTSLVYRGTVTGGTADKLLVAYLGDLPVTMIESSFNGTLVAPGAPVRLGGTGGHHSGAVFAKDLEIDPSVQFTFVAFSGWDNLTFDVTPLLSCVEKRADNTFAAVLGYDNPNPKPVTVLVGSQNAFQGNPANRGQPTSFLPGHFPSEFSVDFVQATPMTWQLNGTNLAIATSATGCPSTITASLAQDTTVALSAPTANFGSTTTLTVGDNSDALVQFDRDQVRKTVGVGRYVVKASLVLAQSSGTQPGIEALAMTKGWTELGATWNCANDTDLSATGQACVPGSTWKLDRDDLTRKNPWLLHAVSRRVVGTYAGGKVTFDVTRDVWNLLGSDGFQHPAAWALLKQSGSIGTAVLASRESGNAPQLVLTLATRPQTAAPLSVLVNTALKPANATVPPLADGITRTVATLLAPHSPQADFVERELLFNINSDAELPPILARWNGAVVREIRPPADVKFYPTTAVVRIDTTLAQSDALLPRLLKIDNRPMGANAFSSAVGLATMAAAAEEALAGRRVSMNWISKFTGDPSLEDWSTRSIADGAWTGGGPPLSSNAFFWPGFASCDPDPGSPNFPPPCRTKLPDGSGIFQQLTVADAWRALALSGRLLPASVDVSLLDSGFAASHPDYPPVAFGGDSLTDQSGPVGSPEFAHGTFVTLAGFGHVGNGFGAAGPGGPVSKVALVSIPVTRDGIIFGVDVGLFSGTRIMSTSVQNVIPAVATIFTSMSELTQETRNANVDIFASAGNDGADVNAEDCFIVCWESNHYSPCEDDGVDCVTGMGVNDTSKDPQSNWGSNMKTIAGPYHTGVSNTNLSLVNGIVQPATGSGGVFNPSFGVFFAGTSGSSPFVAGIASLLVAADPSQNADRIEHCLFEPAHQASDGFFTQYPDALASVRCVGSGNSFADLPSFLHVVLPGDGSSFNVNQLVNVQANATDFKIGQLTVAWTSDIDGTLTTTGSGQVGVLQFKTAGTHHLTASAVGSDGVTVQQTLTIFVGTSAPQIFIANPPADGMHFPEGFPLTLQAGLGAFANPNCSLFKWSSTSSTGILDFDGSPGCQLQPKFFGQGLHKIVVGYKDPVTGLLGVANRQIIIDAVHGFLAKIVTPANVPGQTADIEQPLTLSAFSNAQNVSYQWTVTANGLTFTVPGTLSTAIFNPSTFIAETCFPIGATIELHATNDDDATQSRDVEQISFTPSAGFVTSNCVK